MADGIGIEAIWLGRRARRFRQIIDGADRSRWGAPFNERDELIIDLTCDSFLHDPLPAPFVGVDRTWHDQWKVDFSSSIGDWHSANRPHFNAFFGTAYAQVLRAGA